MTAFSSFLLFSSVIQSTILYIKLIHNKVNVPHSFELR